MTQPRLIEPDDKLAADVSPGANNLLFIPYFTGEQSPGWNPHSTGMFYGMTFRHETRHYIRAVIEGIIFSLLRVAKPNHAGLATPVSLGDGQQQFIYTFHKTGRVIQLATLCQQCLIEQHLGQFSKLGFITLVL